MSPGTHLCLSAMLLSSNKHHIMHCPISKRIAHELCLSPSQSPVWQDLCLNDSKQQFNKLKSAMLQQPRLKRA